MMVLLYRMSMKRRKSNKQLFFHFTDQAVINCLDNAAPDHAAPAEAGKLQKWMFLLPSSKGPCCRTPSLACLPTRLFARGLAALLSAASTTSVEGT
jgi:hypothetical protein